MDLPLSKEACFKVLEELCPPEELRAVVDDVCSRHAASDDDKRNMLRRGGLGATPMLYLPFAILTNFVLKFITDRKDVLNFRAVCRSFCSAVREAGNFPWHDMKHRFSPALIDRDAVKTAASMFRTLTSFHVTSHTLHRFQTYDPKGEFLEPLRRGLEGVKMVTLQLLGPTVEPVLPTLKNVLDLCFQRHSPPKTLVFQNFARQLPVSGTLITDALDDANATLHTLYFEFGLMIPDMCLDLAGIVKTSASTLRSVELGLPLTADFRDELDSLFAALTKCRRIQVLKFLTFTCSLPNLQKLATVKNVEALMFRFRRESVGGAWGVTPAMILPDEDLFPHITTLGFANEIAGAKMLSAATFTGVTAVFKHLTTLFLFRALKFSKAGREMLASIPTLTTLRWSNPDKEVRNLGETGHAPSWLGSFGPNIRRLAVSAWVVWSLPNQCYRGDWADKLLEKTTLDAFVLLQEGQISAGCDGARLVGGEAVRAVTSHLPAPMPKWVPGFTSPVKLLQVYAPTLKRARED